MPIITVTIDNKTYRMSCGKDEEAHLTALTQDFSERVAQMRTSFGEIGDMRLHVMAALTISDELSDLRIEADITQEKLKSAEAANEKNLKRISHFSDLAEGGLKSPGSEGSVTSASLQSTFTPERPISDSRSEERRGGKE